MASRHANTTHLRNVNDTVVNATAGRAVVTDIFAINTSGATAFVQVFDSAASGVTLGTTRPVLSITLAATTGLQHLAFSQGIVFETRCSVASATAAEGSTGSADGVFVQVWVV